MSGTMVQLDLAARSCPLRVAGTVFATLMALSNVSVLLATTLGGQVYDLAAARWNTPTAFNILLIFGTLTTAACWLLMPRLPTQVDYAPAELD
jgi:hypothetical protein